MGGFECTNIKGVLSENVVMDNVLVENGSRGFALRECHNSVLNGVVAKNARGPFPGGSGIQFEYSNNIVM